MTQTIDLADVLKEWLRSRQMMIRVALPAMVESYDPAKQTVDVKPMIRDVNIDADGGVLVESLPVLPDVPVLHARGGGYFVALPIKKGDFVQLLINDRCLDQWRTKAAESDPADLRMHDLSDAVAFPCGYPDTMPLADATADTLVFGKDGGPVIQIDDTLVSLFAKNAEDWVALASKTDARIKALEDAYKVHTHPSAMGPTGTPTAPFVNGTSVASSKVKAE